MGVTTDALDETVRAAGGSDIRDSEISRLKISGEDLGPRRARLTRPSDNDRSSSANGASPPGAGATPPAQPQGRHGGQ